MILILGIIKMLSPTNEEQDNNKNKSIKKGDNQIKSTLNYDDEELLILSVQERRPLWDFTLPLEQRCQRVTRKLWDEISEILEGKKNVKNIRD